MNNSNCTVSYYRSYLMILQFILMWFCHSANRKPNTAVSPLWDGEMFRSYNKTAESPFKAKGSLTPTPESFNYHKASRPHICVTEAASQSWVWLLQTWLWCACAPYSGWGGFTPLHYAALHGNRALVDLFLSNGADPNLTCDSGQTAFHFACR